MINQSAKSLAKAVKICGGYTALSKKIGVTYCHIWNWTKAGQVPVAWCIPIEKAVDGKVTRYDLRPDIYEKE